MSGVKRRLRGSLTVQKLGAVRLDEAVVGLAFLQGSRYAALTASGGLYLADAAGGEARRLGGHEQGGLTLAVQPGGMRVATGGQDGTIRLWDTAAGRETCAIETGTAWVERVAWRPNGSRFAAALGRRVGVWAADGSRLGISDDHASTVADIAWSPDGSRIATAAYGGAAFLSSEGAGPSDHVALKGSSLLLAWQSQGRYLAVGNQDATVLFVLVESLDTLQMWGFPTKVMALGWSDDGRALATAAGSGVILWDASGAGPKSRTPTILEGHFGSVTTLAWQPRGPILASGGSDGQVCLAVPARPATRRRRGDADPPTIEADHSITLDAEATALVWTPAGSLLAVGDRSGTVAVHRVG
jgi:WD40 repeat protein